MTTPTPPPPHPTGSDAAGAAVKHLSPTEKHDRLADAARRYLDGDITVEQFEAVEAECLPDYRAAVTDLIAARERYRQSQAPKGTRIRRWLAALTTTGAAEAGGGEG